MEFYFSVSISRLVNTTTGRGKTKKVVPAWHRTFDSSYAEWETAYARVGQLKDLLLNDCGEFVDEQIISTRNGSYHWTWWNVDKNSIIEIRKVDFGRVYDWDVIEPIRPS